MLVIHPNDPLLLKIMAAITRNNPEMLAKKVSSAAFSALVEMQAHGETEKPHPFSFGEKVYADNDMNCAMIATGFLYQKEGDFVQCKYFANGQHVEVFVEAWRLKSKDES